MNREKEGTRKTEDEGRPGSLPLKTLSRMGGGGRESIKRYLAFLNGTWPIEWHFEGVRERGREARTSGRKRNREGIRDAGATSDSGVESEGPRWPPLFYSSSFSPVPIQLAFISCIGNSMEWFVSIKVIEARRPFK